ncbi:MAG: hypothetical protein RR379_11515, partial [Clostridia bacterium]
HLRSPHPSLFIMVHKQQNTWVHYSFPPRLRQGDKLGGFCARARIPSLKQARSKLSRSNGNSTFQSSLMITQMGKKTQLYQALSGLVRNRMC